MNIHLGDSEVLVIDQRDNSILSEYLSDEQLAGEMRVSVRTLWRWAALGEIPPSVKIGRRRYFRRTAIAEWLKAREHISDS